MMEEPAEFVDKDRSANVRSGSEAGSQDRPGWGCPESQPVVCFRPEAADHLVCDVYDPIATANDRRAQNSGNKIILPPEPDSKGLA
jgi:hypothetical protein